MTTHLQPEPASGGFDYASMRSDIANQMRTAAHRIHQLHRAAVVDDIGRELIAIKDRIEHGHFVEWTASGGIKMPVSVHAEARTGQQPGRTSRIHKGDRHGRR